jgi:hypothetical protein
MSSVYIIINFYGLVDFELLHLTVYPVSLQAIKENLNLKGTVVRCFQHIYCY